MLLVGLILAGFFWMSITALTKGANYLVTGSADLARHFKVPPIVVGLTIVALATSLPEFIVSLFAVLAGSPNLAIGNIIGSNIVNIGLCIALSAIIFPLAIRSTTLTFEFPIMLVTSFLFLLLSNDRYIFRQEGFSIGRIDGVIFVIIFAVFIYYLYRFVRRDPARKEFREEFKHKNPLSKNIMFIIAGALLLVMGGKIFVEVVTFVSRLFGISEGIIGLTVVSIGTSLPEIFTTIVAASKKETDIVIGNIVGSNIFNIVFVVGIISIIKPITVDPALIFFDGMVMIFITLLFWIFASSRAVIGRLEGAILLMSYTGYITYLITTI